MTIFALVLIVGPVVAPAHAASWVRAFSEHGVVVDTRAGAGGNMPEFRGITTVKARIWEVLSVIDDVSAVCEWAKRCVDNRELSRDSFTRRIFYNRTGAPWPFSDRDNVLRTKVSGLEGGRDIRLHFHRVKVAAMPAVAGVIRMPVMDGMYRLIALAPDRTRIIFQVRAHPGGWVPDWVARWVSKRIPIDTLVGLRRQVVKTRGRYEAFLNKWDPDRRKKAVKNPTVAPSPPGNAAAPKRVK